MAEQASYPTNDGTVAQTDLDDIFDLQDTDSTPTMDTTLPSANGGDHLEFEDLLIFFEDEDQPTPVDRSTQLHEPLSTHEPTDVHESSLLDMLTVGRELALVQEPTSGQAAKVEVEAEAEAEEVWEDVPKKSKKSRKSRKSRQDTAQDTPMTAFASAANRVNELRDSPNGGDEDIEINHHLNERFRGNIPSRPLHQGISTPKRPKMVANQSIREYFNVPQTTAAQAQWLSTPIIPTAEEIAGAAIGATVSIDDVPVKELVIPVNRIEGAWGSKDEYLEAHYKLLREDAVAPLRSAVEEVRAHPDLLERDSQEHAAIYDNVYINGVTFAPQGIAVRVEFSLRRAGKKVRWEQSKRLTSGSIVALTPANDMFRKICRVAVVAARPRAGLNMNPPSIDLFFRAIDEFEIDPQREWVMVEARSAYYEAYRHTLSALQKIAHERFPLAEHLVSVQSHVSPPHYVQQQPVKDLSLAETSISGKYVNVNMLDNWPEQLESDLDPSQMAALRHILTKRMAIVQGPPGTGKTHVSVVALKLLLDSIEPGDPPIIVTAQTNHALDQLLRHVSLFEPDFVRLGGRSGDYEIIKPRTMWAIRQQAPLPALVGGLSGSARKQRKGLAQKLTVALGPLRDGSEPLPAELLLNFNLISEAQYKSLVDGAEGWVGGNDLQSRSILATWMGPNLIVHEKQRDSQQSGLQYEEVDQEFEQLKEIEAEHGWTDDDDQEALKGEWVPLFEPFTGQQAYGVTDLKVQSLLRQQDMWRIPHHYRGTVYRFLQRQVKDKLCYNFRSAASDYPRTAQNGKIGGWEVDAIHLQKARIIGMTTTGLSKYRALVASVKPKVVLIEEAAETFEAHVVTACFDTVEHLILVGDHKQLRGHCAVRELEGEPFNLEVSLFERMINNRIEYSQLTRQRRMRPEFREILAPIYAHLDDHPSVLGREDIPGMGGINFWFHSHQMPDSNDDAMSKQNEGEADLIVGFFEYLFQNGTRATDITVLTFYNGQRKRILRGLKKYPEMQGQRFNVSTVDSYQGEENEVIMLSLVRNNNGSTRGIGFLNIENRVCVALSRARRGFYIFGNDWLLRKSSVLWEKVIAIMERGPTHVGTSLPITCKKHHRRTEIKRPSQWDDRCGGCGQPCRDALPCGHVCQLTCHPMVHSEVKCHMRCNRRRACSHRCSQECWEPCKRPCDKKAAPLPPPPVIEGVDAPRRPSPGQAQRQRPLPPTSRVPPPANAYQAFAAGGHVAHDARLNRIAREDAVQARQRMLDQRTEEALFGGGVEEPMSPVVESRGGANGGRVRRAEVWRPGEAAGWEAEPSLLD